MNNSMQIIDYKTELERIFTENYEKLYACAYRMAGNPQDTEDVLQNAFVKAFKNIHTFKGNSKLYTWVYRIVVNEGYRFFDYINKLPLTCITDDLGVSEETFFNSIDYTPSLDDDLIIEDMRERCLQAFLKCMPKNQRVCFILKSCIRLKNKEISEILDISVENVKVTLHRGRKKLQELFEMRCNLIDPSKPCKCHLWIKYMKDHNLEIPKGYAQIKNEALKKKHFKNLSLLKKIDYLYTVESTCDKITFIKELRKITEIM